MPDDSVVSAKRKTPSADWQHHVRDTLVNAFLSPDNMESAILPELAATRRDEV